MAYRYCLTVILGLTASLGAQSQRWVARYNGPANVVDGGTAIAVDPVGNVYVTGRSGDTPATFECTTIKYDSAGTERWIRKYRLVDSSYYDTGWGIALDRFGYLYVTLASSSIGTRDDIAVIKYDTSGNQCWVRRYSGPGNDYDWPFGIAVDGSSNVYVTGRSVGSGTSFDYVTIKWDSAGNEKWAQRYDGAGNATDEAYSIAVDRTGNVYVTGTSTGAGTRLDFVTIKYDSLGTELWAKPYNSPGNQDEYGATLAIDSSGNTYVFGGTWIFGAVACDYITVKYNANGDTLWTRKYNGPANDEDTPDEIVFDRAGYIYVSGGSYTNSTNRVDYCTVKYDVNGNEKWVRRYNGPGNGADQPEALAIDVYGNVFVTGTSRGTVDDDYASVVYDSLGSQITAMRYDGPGTWADAAQDIVADARGNFYITGFSGGNNSTYDFTTIKYSGITSIESNQESRIAAHPFIPTLFAGPLPLPKGSTCRIFDITGRQADVNSLKPGVYFIELDARTLHKVVKIR